MRGRRLSRRNRGSAGSSGPTLLGPLALQARVRHTLLPPVTAKKVREQSVSSPDVGFSADDAPSGPVGAHQGRGRAGTRRESGAAGARRPTRSRGDRGRRRRRGSEPAGSGPAIDAIGPARGRAEGRKGGRAARSRRHRCPARAE